MCAAVAGIFDNDDGDEMMTTRVMYIQVYVYLGTVDSTKCAKCNALCIFDDRSCLGRSKHWSQRVTELVHSSVAPPGLGERAEKQQSAK